MEEMLEMIRAMKAVGLEKFHGAHGRLLDGDRGKASKVYEEVAEKLGNKISASTLYERLLYNYEDLYIMLFGDEMYMKNCRRPRGPRGPRRRKIQHSSSSEDDSDFTPTPAESLWHRPSREAKEENKLQAREIPNETKFRKKRKISVVEETAKETANLADAGENSLQQQVVKTVTSRWPEWLSLRQRCGNKFKISRDVLMAAMKAVGLEKFHGKLGKLDENCSLYKELQSHLSRKCWPTNTVVRLTKNRESIHSLLFGWTTTLEDAVVHVSVDEFVRAVRKVGVEHFCQDDGQLVDPSNQVFEQVAVNLNQRMRSYYVHRQLHENHYNVYSILFGPERLQSGSESSSPGSCRENEEPPTPAIVEEVTTPTKTKETEPWRPIVKSQPSLNKRGMKKSSPVCILEITEAMKRVGLEKFHYDGRLRYTSHPAFKELSTLLNDRITSTQLIYRLTNNIESIHSLVFGWTTTLGDRVVRISISEFINAVRSVGVDKFHQNGGFVEDASHDIFEQVAVNLEHKMSAFYVHEQLERNLQNVHSILFGSAPKRYLDECVETVTRRPTALGCMMTGTVQTQKKVQRSSDGPTDIELMKALKQVGLERFHEDGQLMGPLHEIYEEASARLGGSMKPAGVWSCLFQNHESIHSLLFGWTSTLEDDVLYVSVAEYVDAVKKVGVDHFYEDEKLVIASHQVYKEVAASLDNRMSAYFVHQHLQLNLCNVHSILFGPILPNSNDEKVLKEAGVPQWYQNLENLELGARIFFKRPTPGSLSGSIATYIASSVLKFQADSTQLERGLEFRIELVNAMNKVGLEKFHADGRLVPSTSTLYKEVSEEVGCRIEPKAIFNQLNRNHESLHSLSFKWTTTLEDEVVFVSVNDFIEALQKVGVEKFYARQKLVKYSHEAIAEVVALLQHRMSAYYVHCQLLENRHNVHSMLLFSSTSMNSPKTPTGGTREMIETVGIERKMPDKSSIAHSFSASMKKAIQKAADSDLEDFEPNIHPKRNYQSVDLVRLIKAVEAVGVENFHLYGRLFSDRHQNYRRVSELIGGAISGPVFWMQLNKNHRSIHSLLFGWTNTLEDIVVTVTVSEFIKFVKELGIDQFHNPDDGQLFEATHPIFQLMAECLNNRMSAFYVHKQLKENLHKVHSTLFGADPPIISDELRRSARAEEESSAVETNLNEEDEQESKEEMRQPRRAVSSVKLGKRMSCFSGSNIMEGMRLVGLEKFHANGRLKTISDPVFKELYENLRLKPTHVHYRLLNNHDSIHSRLFGWTTTLEDEVVTVTVSEFNSAVSEVGIDRFHNPDDGQLLDAKNPIFQLVAERLNNRMSAFYVHWQLKTNLHNVHFMLFNSVSPNKRRSLVSEKEGGAIKTNLNEGDEQESKEEIRYLRRSSRKTRIRVEPALGRARKMEVTDLEVMEAMKLVGLDQFHVDGKLKNSTDLVFIKVSAKLGGIISPDNVHHRLCTNHDSIHSMLFGWTTTLDDRVVHVSVDEFEKIIIREIGYENFYKDGKLADAGDEVFTKVAERLDHRMSAYYVRQQLEHNNNLAVVRAMSRSTEVSSSPLVPDTDTTKKEEEQTEARMNSGCSSPAPWRKVRVRKQILENLPSSHNEIPLWKPTTLRGNPGRRTRRYSSGTDSCSEDDQLDSSRMRLAGELIVQKTEPTSTTQDNIDQKGLAKAASLLSASSEPQPVVIPIPESASWWKPHAFAMEGKNTVKTQVLDRRKKGRCQKANGLEIMVAVRSMGLEKFHYGEYLKLIPPGHATFSKTCCLLHNRTSPVTIWKRLIGNRESIHSLLFGWTTTLEDEVVYVTMSEIINAMKKVGVEKFYEGEELVNPTHQVFKQVAALLDHRMSACYVHYNIEENLDHVHSMLFASEPSSTTEEMMPESFAKNEPLPPASCNEAEEQAAVVIPLPESPSWEQPAFDMSADVPLDLEIKSDVIKDWMHSDLHTFVTSDVMEEFIAEENVTPLPPEADKLRSAGEESKPSVDDPQVPTSINSNVVAVTGEDEFGLFGIVIAADLRKIQDLNMARRVQRKLQRLLLDVFDEIDAASISNNVAPVTAKSAEPADDEFGLFGIFIAAELRKIQELQVARRVQRQLQRCLLDFLDDIDANSNSRS